MFALTNVACAKYVGEQSNAEVSLSTSILEPENENRQLQPVSAGLGDMEAIDLGPPEVNDYSILRDLGLYGPATTQEAVASQVVGSIWGQGVRRESSDTLGQSLRDSAQVEQLAGLVTEIPLFLLGQCLQMPIAALLFPRVILCWDHNLCSRCFHY